LKNDLQNAVNNGSERYQTCLYFEMDETNMNNVDDNLWYENSITMTVTYTTNP